MLASNQKMEVGRSDAAAVIQFDHVGLPIPAHHQCRLRHLGGDAGGAPSVNPACPLVHEQVCTAIRNVKQLYRRMGQEPIGLSEAGCPALESSP